MDPFNYQVRAAGFFKELHDPALPVAKNGQKVTRRAVPYPKPNDLWRMTENKAPLVKIGITAKDRKVVG